MKGYDMKKIISLVFTVILVLFASEAAVKAETHGSANIHAIDILELLVKSGIPIDMDSLMVINETNDPEKLFGRTGQAIEKIAFTDIRHPENAHQCYVMVFANPIDMSADIELRRELKNKGGYPQTTSFSYGVVTIRVYIDVGLPNYDEYAAAFYGLSPEQVGEAPL